MQKGVPTIDFAAAPVFSRIFAIPKSPNFTLLDQVRKILDNFKSLWSIFFL
jgi:hypothetical protein